MSKENRQRLNSLSPERRELILKHRRKSRRQDFLAAIGIGAFGLGCLVYALGFIAFWVGVIFLVWRFALSS